MILPTPKPDGCRGCLASAFAALAGVVAAVLVTVAIVAYFTP